MRCMDDGGRKESRIFAECLLVLGLALGQQGRPPQGRPCTGLGGADLTCSRNPHDRNLRGIWQPAQGLTGGHLGAEIQIQGCMT